MTSGKSSGLHLPSRLTGIAVAAMLAAAGHAARADEAGEIKVDGFLRQELSWNTLDWADTPGYNDRGKLSMARTTARVNVDWKPASDVTVVAKLRLVGEPRTAFLKHLEKMGAYNYGETDGRGDLMDLYNKNEASDVIRELYVDFPLGERARVRLGKQQVVWGETDFFTANDLVHGFDYTWRSFLEPANEELRKANIIAKLNIDVPELGGGLEMFVRPGWDRKSDIGTELDVYGSRWSTQSTAGVDFRNIDPYNFRNSEGDAREVTGGVRWTGLAREINYSLSYLKTFWTSPMLNASSTLKLFGAPGAPSGVKTLGHRDTIGAAGELIYPTVDVFGATASGYSEWADAVFSAEVAYIKDAPYQFLRGGQGGPLSQAVAPGFDGIKRKNLLAWMLRMDKNIAATQQWLGTEKPMFFSVQLFDKWVQDYDKDERLLNAVGAGQRTNEHSFLLTGIFDLSYDSGRIKPNLVVGADLSYGGGFIVPSVTFELARNWRWKVEYDKFWNDDIRDARKCGYPDAASCDSASLFGYFHKRDQLYTSLTYLF
ncbi:DUF1302 family protein [Thauera sinica]|uniref:DUF1302 family protein n=1 Tax=Thauera sinica TaxID=2665146 RepID=A0ABW1ATZ7_9RHOO|nr:DUF1302 family protein [Thauera sp. K11]ATE62055.1 LysR family transcriptional regulator [Thauera sp. K11]